MKLLLAMLTVFGMFLSSQLLASDEPLLTSKMDAFLVTLNEDGEEKIVLTDKAQPNDIIEYRLTYDNVSTQPLSELEITGPIPMNTNYIGNSGFTKASSNFLVSIDGGNTFEPEPVKRMVTDKNGKDVEIIISPEKYTAVKWVLISSINPQEEKVFTYRIKVQ